MPQTDRPMRQTKRANEAMRREAVEGPPLRQFQEEALLRGGSQLDGIARRTPTIETRLGRSPAVGRTRRQGIIWNRWSTTSIESSIAFRPMYGSMGRRIRRRVVQLITRLLLGPFNTIGSPTRRNRLYVSGAISRSVEQWRRFIAFWRRETWP